MSGAAAIACACCGSHYPVHNCCTGDVEFYIRPEDFALWEDCALHIGTQCYIVGDLVDAAPTVPEWAGSCDPCRKDPLSIIGGDNGCSRSLACLYIYFDVTITLPTFPFECDGYIRGLASDYPWYAKAYADDVECGEKPPWEYCGVGYSGSGDDCIRIDYNFSYLFRRIDCIGSEPSPSCDYDMSDFTWATPPGCTLPEGCP